MALLETRTDTTVKIRDGEIIENIKVVNSDPEQIPFIVDANARGWTLRNCESHGGKYNILRGSHGVAHQFRVFGTSHFGICAHESGTNVKEGVTNDLTISEFRVEDAGLSAVGGMGVQRGLTMRDGVIQRAGQDGVTQYDDRSDNLRLINVDIYGYKNHGIHLGGRRAWVDNVTVQGGTHEKASALAFFNHLGKPRMHWAHVGRSILDGDRHVIWARELDFLIITDSFLYSHSDEVTGTHVYNDGGTVKTVREHNVFKY